MKRSCGTQPNPACARRCVGTADTSRPAKRTVPRWIRVMPISVTSSVDLPTPLRPSSARLSPSSSATVTSSSTFASP